VSELLISINNINIKTSSLNKININVIKDRMDIIEPYFLIVINNSLRMGIVPESWKKSKVIPIPKIVGTYKCEELRPINMLPAYEKILETIVKTQLL